jgi:hypothetical protein
MIPHATCFIIASNKSSKKLLIIWIFIHDQQYSSWDHSSGFVRHAEVRLIQYLINQRKELEAIGISNYCCAYCTEWINKVNEHRKLIFWRVGGCHGRRYYWGRDPMPSPSVLRLISQSEIMSTKNSWSLNHSYLIRESLRLMTMRSCSRRQGI